MRSQFWTEEEIRIVEEKIEDDWFYADIAEELQNQGHARTHGAVRCLVQRLKKTSRPIVCNTKKRDPDNVCKDLFKDKSKKDLQEEQAIARGIAYASAVKEIQRIKEEALDICSEKYDLLGAPKGKLYKILSLSDFHIPFENEEVINHALKNHGDASAVVINGDFFDQYSVSKWPKNKQYLLRHEYELAIEWIKILTKKFKRVFLVKGNHDKRTESHFMAHIDPGVSFLTHPDMLERLAEGYDFDSKTGSLVKKYDFDNIYYTPGACSWYTKIGECLFAHPSGGSIVPMKTVHKTAQYFLEREDFSSVSTVIIGHSHKLGKIIWKNKLLIEQGCCCVPMEYEADAKLSFGQQTFGYAVVYMNADGEVDFKKTEPIYYGTGAIVRPDVHPDIFE